MDWLSEGFGVSPGRHTGSLINDLFKKIGERGWLGISYPKEYGGQGGDRMTQYIVEEEFARANISLGLGGSGAPAILAAGHRRAEAALHPEADQRRVFVRARLHRAACRRRSRVAAMPGGARRRRVRHQRAEDVHLGRPHGDAHLPDGADQPQSAEAPRHLDLPVPDGHAGHHRSPAVDHPERSAGADRHHLRHAAHQRNVLRRCAHPGKLHAGQGERGLARRRAWG